MISVYLTRESNQEDQSILDIVRHHLASLTSYSVIGVCVDKCRIHAKHDKMHTWHWELGYRSYQQADDFVLRASPGFIRENEYHTAKALKDSLDSDARLRQFKLEVYADGKYYSDD